MAFVKALIRNRNEHEIILALNGMLSDSVQQIRDEFSGLLPEENIKIWFAQESVFCSKAANKERRDIAELIREAFLASLEPDIIHVCSLFEGYVDDAVTSVGRLDTVTPVSVTLYDLIPLVNKGDYLEHNKLFRRYYENKVAHLEHASLCMAISDFAKCEALEYLNLHSGHVINMSSAVDDIFKPSAINSEDERELREKFELDRPFVLYVGGADVRKNLPRLIQAFAELPLRFRINLQLVIAGRLLPEEQELLIQSAQNAGLLAEDLVLTGLVSDDELVKLYNLCELFVFPSWHEGFGLPALEAMACGAPVIAANASSIPEIVGRDDALFDPFSVPTITQKMIEVLDNQAFREKLRGNGLRQAKRFSWEKTAKTAIHAFERLCVASKAIRLPTLGTDGAKQRLLSTLGSSISLSQINDNDLAKVSLAISQSFPKPRRPQLFVDVSVLIKVDSGTGIQRVVRSILRGLLSNPPGKYEVRAVYEKCGYGYYLYANQFQQRLRGDAVEDVRDSIVEPQYGDIFLGLDLEQSVVCRSRGFYQKIRNVGGKVFFVVYDLLPIQVPQFFPEHLDEKHARWLDVVIENDGAVCISKAVADELRMWMKGRRDSGRVPFQVRWFHLGSDLAASMPSKGLPSSAEETLNNIASHPSFLMVGTLEPRKGHGQALAAMENLWDRGWDIGLVIVGKFGWGVKELARKIENHSQHGNRLLWIKNASDEYLEAIYNTAACCLMASEGEGFGLPLIEASKFGMPILARDIPVFREVVGESAFYFSGNSKDNLASAMLRMIQAINDDNAPKTSTIERLTWQESTEQLVDAILPQNREVVIDYELQGDLASTKKIDYVCQPTVLQLAPYPIRMPRHGGQLRASSIRRILSEAGFRVQSIGFFLEGAYLSPEVTEADILFPEQSPFREYKGKRIPELSDFLMASFSCNDEIAYQKVLRGITTKIDIILVEQSWFYPLAKRLVSEVSFCENALLVNSTYNIEAPMKAQMFTEPDSVTIEAIDEISAFEQAVARDADLTIAVTEQDACILKKYGAKRVVVVANGTDPWAADFQRIDYWRARLPEAAWPLFVSSAHPPNIDGFVTSVGDALGCIPPKSKLVVAGGGSSLLKKVLLDSQWSYLNASRIQVLGVLDDEDLAAVKHLTHAFLLPIALGGGSNVKTAEALYSGKHVICTETAMRGFEEFKDLPNLTIVNTQDRFQWAIRQALSSDCKLTPDTEKERRMRQRLTWSVCLHDLPDILHNALHNKGNSL
jgi:glycosyltransferase involved in cell wall biosynthesis